MKLINGNCLEKLKDLETNSIDSIVTDPPYELGFMGKSWDSTGIAYNIELWKECLRVLKPGGHLLAFSGTRTYHRMAVAIEDAGFEVRDMIEWVYGSGFPKSLNIGKAVDKLQGNERKNIEHRFPDGSKPRKTANQNFYTGGDDKLSKATYTKGTSEWEGWGTALKPAHEPICMARKPLAEKTVAENCLKWGTGGINIDESRVGTEVMTEGRAKQKGSENWQGDDRSNGKGSGFKDTPIENPKISIGRFPANLIHDNSEEVRECFPDTKSGNLNSGHKRGDGTGNSFMGGGGTVTGNYGGDSGNASRFFKSIIYQAKASKSERNKGCEELEEKEKKTLGSFGDQSEFDCPDGANRVGNKGTSINQNNHPTVKPIALMEYLIRMVTPKGGIVLDPFTGSGSTLVAAKQNGFQYIGIEMTEEYIPIIEARLDAVEEKPVTLF